MGKLTLKVNISFSGKVVEDADSIEELLMAAIEHYKDGSDAMTKQVAAAVINAAWDKGLDGVLEFAYRRAIRSFIKEEFDDITGKSPAVITFR